MASSGGDLSRARVLIADDDADIRILLAQLLTDAGFEVDAASDGKDALTRIQDERYDVVVTDIAMPELGGLDLLRAVREHDLDVPVILLTGKPGLDSAVKAIEYGAFRYFVKPFDLDEFVASVRRAVTVHRLAHLRREAMEVVGLPKMQLGDLASLHARFEHALEGLYMAFQPIVRLPEREVLAYEALLRTTEPSLANPVGLLDAAHRLGRVHELGRRIRAEVAAAASEAPPDALLFVNVNAVELSDNELLSSSAPLSKLAQRVVLEVTERTALDGVDGLMTRRRKLRELGFRVAIDDLGAGYAGLSSFSQLDPEFVKLDRSLIQDVHEDARRLKIVGGMAALCRGLGIETICEGVETAAERDALIEAGARLQQGYLFARPAAGFPAPRWD
jgi:EAL domain-containing protein (putative c-di-GMP-specific phosphodiesterase class I)